MHTPGPWRIDGESGRYWRLYAAGNKSLWHLEDYWGDDEAADARLIAAAPEMYDLLYEAFGVEQQDVRDNEHHYLDASREWCKKARALLLQIEGHGDPPSSGKVPP